MNVMHPIHRAVKTFGALVVAAVVATGCASTPEGGVEQGARIIVDNTGTAIASATVYLVPETGVRQILGSVSLGERESFEVTVSPTDRYILTADVGTSTVRSPSFIVTEGDVMEWDMDTNNVQLVSD